MTDEEAAKLLRMSRRNLLDLRGSGILPVAGADQDAYLDAYIPWVREIKRHGQPRAEKVDLDTEKARLAREQADQTALKNAAMRGELVPLSIVSQAVVGMIEVAKAKLKRLPAKIAPGDAKLKQRIADGIEGALIDLSAERATEIRKPADAEGDDAEPDDD